MKAAAGIHGVEYGISIHNQFNTITIDKRLGSYSNGNATARVLCQ